MAKKPAVIAALFLVAAGATLAWLLWPGERGQGHNSGGAAKVASPLPGADSRTVRTGPSIAPRPFTEAPESAETSAATRPAVEIEVVDEAAAPAAGARLFAYRGETVLADLTCGTDGVVRFAASDGDADVLVNLAGAPLHHERLSLRPGRRRIEMPRGAAISGSVEVDGHLPAKPVPLRLLWVPCDDWIDRVPSPVAAHLSGQGLRRQVSVATRGDGRFRFTGLPAGWSGALRLDDGSDQSYGWEGSLKRSADGEAPHLAVTAPAEGLIVRLHRWPVLSGRVVAADTHVPIPRANIRCGISSDSGDSTSWNLPCDEQGRFRVTLDVWHPVKITLDVEDPSGLGGRHLERTGEFQGDVDLGDVEIGAIRSVAFAVKDVAGAPIPGAVASTGPRNDVLSQPTDAEGRSTIRVETEAAGMRVAAIGFESVEVRVPHELTAPLVVTLPRGVRLVVRLTSPSGEVPPGISVVIGIRQPWFDVSLFWPEPALIAAGATPTNGSSLSEHGFEGQFHPDARGRVVLAGIRAGVAIDVQAQDELLALEHVDHLTMEAGESREHVIVVDHPPNPFRGVVRDGKGSPLSGADVTVCVALPHVVRKSTDAAGRFAFEGIYADHVDVRIDKEGSATLVRKKFELSGPESEAVFVLTQGRQIAVTVVDADGQTVRASSVVAEVPGSPEVTGRHEPSGSFVLDTLPEATVSLRATVGGRAYSQNHDTKKPTARIVVPAHGSLQVSWDFRLEAASVNQLRVEPAAPGGPSLTEFVQNSEEMVRGDFTLPAVLPGQYVVWLEAKVFDPMSDAGGFHPLSKRATVTVTAGAVTKAVLTP